ncbi:MULTISPECIES: hypothetical protein [unclassified Streptomyces]|nr:MULTISPECIES: hypothetical protein [unclassified Streptomyces]
MPLPVTVLHTVMPRCRCGKWQTYMGAWDSDGYTIRCHGCLRAIWRCTC